MFDLGSKSGLRLFDLDSKCGFRCFDIEFKSGLRIFDLYPYLKLSIRKDFDYSIYDLRPSLHIYHLPKTSGIKFVGFDSEAGL